jgi:hypothetical protein
LHSPFAYQVVRGRKGNLARSGRLVKKANQVLRGLLVLRDLLAHRVLRAHKVLLARQVLPRTPFELYVSTARNQNEVLVIGYCGPRRIPVTVTNERTATCPKVAASSPLTIVCVKAGS